MSYKRSGQPGRWPISQLILRLLIVRDNATCGFFFKTENVFGSDNENVLNAPKTEKIHTQGIVRVTCLRTD